MSKRKRDDDGVGVIDDPDQVRVPGTERVQVAGDRLRSLVERIERLAEERKAISSDIADIYLETKSAGFDVKVVRRLVAERRQEPSEVEEQLSLLELYREALGG